MKKLVFTYIGVVLTVIIVSVIFSFNKSSEPESIKTLKLPQKIKVFFHQENCVREVDFEEYLVCVVSAEVPASFHKEAIKAQAVAARTYIYNKYKKVSENPSLAPDEHKDAFICTDFKHCCAYYSKEKLMEIHGEEWMKNYFVKIVDCVKETDGEILLYDGEPITASFHASSGGCRTENSGDVWTSDLPYLVSVESPGEDKREGYNTVVTVSCDEFKQKINEKYPNAQLSDDRNGWFGDISYTQGNSVDKIKIGKADIRGTEMRSLFGLKSACFEISMLDDRVTFNVHGSGHGVGMSQHGANIMAEGGKKYKEILTWYYRGTEIKK